MDMAYELAYNRVPLVSLLLEDSPRYAELSKTSLIKTYKTLKENKLTLEEREIKCLLFASLLYNIDIPSKNKNNENARYVMYCCMFEPLDVNLTLKLLRIDYALPHEKWQLIPYFVNLTQSISVSGLHHLITGVEKLYIESTPKIKELSEINDKIIMTSRKNKTLVDILYQEYDRVIKACVKNYHLLKSLTYLSEEFDKNLDIIKEILLHFDEEIKPASLKLLYLRKNT